MEHIRIENDAIKIQNITKENKLWLWITRFGGLLGIALTVFALSQLLLVKPSVDAEILSFTGDGLKKIKYTDFSGNIVEYYGYKFFTKIALNVSDENLNYSDIKILVKYKDRPPIEAIHFNPNIWFTEWKYGDKRWQFKGVREDRLFLFNSSLTKDKTHFGYLAFIVKNQDSIPPERPESIKLIFTDSHKNLLGQNDDSSATLYWDNPDRIRRVYERNIWEYVSDN